MKRLNRIFLLFAIGIIVPIAAAFSGCETVVSSDGLPYIDHIVIRGFLVAGKTIDSISVIHTLPLNVVFDTNQAAIPNAQVTISVDGKSIPLQYIGSDIGSGFFTDPAHDTVQSGKTYSIDVKWNGLHAMSTTTIPEPPDITIFQLSNLRWDTIIYSFYANFADTSISFEGDVEIGVRPQANEVYAIASDSVADIDSEQSQSNYYDGFYNNYYPSSQVSQDGILRMFDQESFDPRDSNYFVSVGIESFDVAYYNFLQTYNNYNGNGSDPFGTGSANPKWNVTGDGIGIFIGEAKTTRSSAFHR